MNAAARVNFVQRRLAVCQQHDSKHGKIERINGLEKTAQFARIAHLGIGNLMCYFLYSAATTKVIVRRKTIRFDSFVELQQSTSVSQCNNASRLPVYATQRGALIFKITFILFYFIFSSTSRRSRPGTPACLNLNEMPR